MRVRRGVYRVVHFPAGEHEDLVVLWLWAKHFGVFSHETALALHDLSDALPGKVHLAVPSSWRRRRLRVPAGVVLHFADVGAGDRASYSNSGSGPHRSPASTSPGAASCSSSIASSPGWLRSLATTGPIEGATLRRTIDLTFEFRGTHPVPTGFSPPPEFWAAPYATMAANDDLAWKTLPEVTEAVATFLNPVLDSAQCGIWEPSGWLWKWRA